ncbi:hypothetical protein B0A54_07524 [Friedmanniomyces endolithicus]|uniref:Carboxylesterase type B domain-containing protein n=1 Tax=Friedmanniomyces endolithicus TaxID=329885 RepID=A0A4U0V233_9PEZI|nr:hypothetical protein B0A54_07524 [Friedmanniomyces endolithicus]
MSPPSFAALAALSLTLLGQATAQAGYGSQNTSSNSSTTAALPVVDLGYELHQASLYNSTGGFYNFSNIRYAAPPTGENRFRAPVLPATNRTAVQTGLPARICPQAEPAWLLIAEAYIPEYLAGQTVFNASSFNLSSASGGGLPVQDPRTTEDCLFLDVVVPEGIFNNAGKGYGAPVLVWIYGGGYTAGSKSDSGNPAGLLARSESNGAEGVIYVSMNYRLGAFGFLSGPSLQANGDANAGLLDQRLALEWVQAHIASFGGDPNRVTVLGESAGGGSIMHQITAYGGNKGPVPFQQAVPQSPGFQPLVSNQQQENTLNTFLALANVSTIEQARQLPFEALLVANVIQIGRAAALVSELIFTCNTFYLDNAYGNKTFSYFFTVPPALHGEDIPYTYFNGPSPSVLSPPIAIALQEYITHFAETGSPNEAGVPYFVMYGQNATVQDLNITGISEVRDPTANARWDFWQKALIWLSITTSGEPREEGHNGLVPAGEYFLHVPATDPSAPYPISANFRAWPFPSTPLPPLWQQAAENDTTAEGRPASLPALLANEPCRITSRSLACEAAHIIPASEKAWFARNEMDRYGQLAGRSGEAVADSLANQMRLTRDAHWLWDHLQFSVVPREDAEKGGEVAWFTQILGEGEELEEYWHRQRLQSLVGRAPQYLFARFAWDIFPRLHAFLQAGLARRLAVRQADGRVETRLYSPAECQEFTLGQGSGRSASPTKRARSETSGLADELEVDEGDSGDGDEKGSNLGGSGTRSTAASFDSAIAGIEARGVGSGKGNGREWTRYLCGQESYEEESRGRKRQRR